MTARPRVRVLLAAAALAAPGSGSAANACEVTVAVAANFLHAAQQLEEEFEQDNGCDVIVVSGSTGKLFAQIVQGAPFDIFLSADSKHPELLEQRGLSAPGTRFTYAVGRLVLLAKPGLGVELAGLTVLSEDFSGTRVAVANPDLAPYGAAAVETLAAGVGDGLTADVIYAETVGQVFAFVQTANVEFGFVALSQVIGDIMSYEPRRVWQIPRTLHSPIRQDAAMTNRAQANPAAEEFLEFLRSQAARKVIANFGYDVLSP